MKILINLSKHIPNYTLFLNSLIHSEYCIYTKKNYHYNICNFEENYRDLSILNYNKSEYYINILGTVKTYTHAQVENGYIYFDIFNIVTDNVTYLKVIASSSELCDIAQKYTDKDNLTNKNNILLVNLEAILQHIEMKKEIWFDPYIYIANYYVNDIVLSTGFNEVAATYNWITFGYPKKMKYNPKNFTYNVAYNILTRINITIAILTGSNIEAVQTIINSIYKQTCNSENIEILVFGNIKTNQIKHNGLNIKVIYDKNIEDKNWITKKKNMVCEYASNDDIVIIKDYIYFHTNWYQSFSHFVNKNPNYDILMNKIVDEQNHRYLDWITCVNGMKSGKLVDYEIKADEHPKMYVPGAFMSVKKHVLEKNKFDENLVGLNKGSDIEWSKRVIGKYKYTFNPSSTVIAFGKEHLNRWKDVRTPCKCPLCKEK